MQIFLSKVQVALPVEEWRSMWESSVELIPCSPVQSRLAEARKARESSARAKGSSAMLVADPKVDKSSPAGDACVSDLLKTHFLSSPSSCAELVDQIRQACDLVVADVVDQAGGAAESVANQANTEESTYQESPTGVSE
ncbi:unnamed protein product [Prunus armeniaca]